MAVPGLFNQANQETILHNPLLLGNKKWRSEAATSPTRAQQLKVISENVSILSLEIFAFPAFPEAPPQLRDRPTRAASFRSVPPEFISARLKVSLFFKGALIKLPYTWAF